MTDHHDDRTADMTDGEPREDPRAALREALFEIKRVIVGQDGMLERVLVSLLAGGHVLLEGVPGLAKTLTVKTVAQVLGGSFQPRAVHAGPGARRPGRHADLPPRHRGVRDAPRAGVRQLPAGRRDQPRPREGAVGAAGGDAGAPGDDRRLHLPGAAAVPGARHAEPDRVRGHLPAARGAARPLPDEDRGRLPVRGRGGRGRRTQPRRRAGDPPAARRPRDSSITPGRPTRWSSTGSSSATRSRWRRHPRPRRPRDARAGADGRLRREPARPDRHWCRRLACSRCCAAAGTSWPTTSATSPPTSCATGWCCPTTRSARASPPTRCSSGCWSR